MTRFIITTFLCFGILCSAQGMEGAAAELKKVDTPKPASQKTRVVMLGTGTPVPDPARAGPSVAVIYGGQSYVFDLGAGTVRNAVIASQKLGIEELFPTRIKHLFFTHIHSDHTADLSELVQTLWFREQPNIQLYGPKEFQTIVDGLRLMVSPDVEARMKSIQPVKRKERSFIDVHVIRPGLVFDQNGVKISAFLVDHGDLVPSYGYKIVTPDKTIVLSGDTTYNENVIEQAKGADILLHEVMSEEGLSRLSEGWQKYHHAYHSTSGQVAKVASMAKPKLLVLYHVLFFGASENSVLQEVKSRYSGTVVLAKDLDEF